MSFKPKQLRDTVDTTIIFDKYTPKTGKANVVAVITFTVLNQDVAQDLSKFIEFSSIMTNDVECSPSDNSKYLVHVEIPRSNMLVDQTKKLIKEVNQLADNARWFIAPYLTDEVFDIRDSSWELYVQSNPGTYKTKEEWDQIDSTFENIAPNFKNLSERKRRRAKFKTAFGPVALFAIDAGAADMASESIFVKNQPISLEAGAHMMRLREALGANNHIYTVNNVHVVVSPKDNFFVAFAEM